MALSILDGNQSATTLSTILSSGQHITAHTVVSLGTQAITDIVNATSAGLTNTQLRASAVTIGGTVTVGNSLTISSLPALAAGSAQIGSVTVGNATTSSAVFVKICGERTGAAQNETREIQTDDEGFLYAVLADPSSPSAKAVIYDPAVGNAYVNVRQTASVTIGSALPAGTNRIGVVTIGGGTVTIGAGTAQIGSVTVGNSVTIGSLPAISGTVTISNISSLPDAGENPVIRTFMFGYDYDNEVPIAIASDGNALKISGIVTIGNSVTIGSLPAISGTVTANLTQIAFTNTQGGIASDDGGTEPNLGIQLGYYDGDYKTVKPSQPLPISGTVTANSSNGSLTTRFGSVTTANTAFATSAVTNANRKYLLIQNITTASNVITVGIGFTPTTTQGIQLFAGAGLTFEGSYIPTGAVNLLSSVTASCYTILEA